MGEAREKIGPSKEDETKERERKREGVSEKREVLPPYN